MNNLTNRSDAIVIIHPELTREQHDLCYEIQFAIMREVANLDHEKIWELIQKAIEEKEPKVDMPSAEPEDYTEMKREFIRMASYIDVLLECSDEQKETLMGYISRLSEYMPWTERD